MAAVGLEIRVRRSLAMFVSSLCLALSLWHAQVATGADDQPLRRWAVLASQDLQQAGLSDLLMVELAKVKGVELVEREQLAAATKELEVSTLFGFEAAEGRLKLGRLLKADALLLISLEEREIDVRQKRQFLRAVISECRLGARLHAANIPYEPGEVESLARRCAAKVQETLRRFAHGIKQIVGVPPLVSKNLVHDYDRFQASYARLVETALESFPGVAVLEIEEARAIGQELAGGGKIGDRVLPVFVEGEFEMTSKAPGAEPTVRLTVRITDGKRSLGAIERSGLALDAVPELLTGEVPRTVARLANIQTGAPVPRETQVRALTARADEFAANGAWEHSVPLREAALLLDPKNVDQRVFLMLEYEYALRAKFHLERGAPTNYAYERGPRASKQHNDKVFEVLWRYPAAHVEYLIRNRLLNRYEGAVLLDSMLDLALLPGDFSAEHRGLLREYFWRMYPLLSRLDYAPDGRIRQVIQTHNMAHRCWQPKSFTPSAQDQLWVDAGCHSILATITPGEDRWVEVDGVKRPQFFCDDRTTLDGLHRFLTEVAPETISPVRSLCEFLALFGHRKSADADKPGRFTADELRRFYGRLKESKAPANVFHGRFGLLSLEFHLKRDGRLDQGMLDEADQLLAVLAAHKWQTHFEKGLITYGDCLVSYREQIVRGLAAHGPTVAKRHPLPLNTVPADPVGRVRFERIAGITADWHTLRECSDTMDMMWSELGVFVMREKGAVKRIFAAPPGGGIRAVDWDGENFWIGTAAEGIAVVSPEGQVVDRVGADQGLPPYESQRGAGMISCTPGYLHLHCVERGKCLAIGAFGPHKRLWFAMLERSPGKDATASRVQVFHKATHLPPAVVSRADDDLEEIFTVAWIKEYAPPGPQAAKLLLVGRSLRESQEWRLDGRRPLAIDLKTLRVSIFPGQLPCSSSTRQDGGNLAWSNGRLLYGTNGALYVFALDEKGERWSRKKLVNAVREDFTVLPWAGQIYSGGANWYCLDPQTLKVDKLTRSPLSVYFNGHAVSAHFGLVAWRAGQLFQVSIGTADQPVFGPDVLYEYVPVDRRQRHASAAEAIRKLGGSVGNVMMNGGRGTQVFLSKQWKGGDAGLAGLQDLHNVRWLSLVQAPVTGEALRYVGGLADLNELNLVETKVTDKDLVQLQNLPRLESLRLEGTAGGNEFSDAGLKTLAGIKSLRYLTLYGPGFTDQAVEPMKNMPELRKVRLHDTAIGNRLLDEFRQSRPGFSWSKSE